MVPRTVLTRSGPMSINTARPVNTVQPRIAVNNAGPMKNVINNAYSTARRPFNKITAANNSHFNKRVNTVNDKNVNATRPNVVVNTARPNAILSAIKGNKRNAIKALACWIQDKGVIDSGCSRYMTGNISYLTDYEEIDGGFVAFGGNSKGGKITRKGKIRTGKLDFEDVYFVKELNFNLFSVSQMRDKKNSILFTDTASIVLSPDFKLTDENHVLLKVPRKNNMYSVDLKNVVPQGVLTCIENLIDLKVKVIRCDNRTEFKNKIMNQFCEIKDIKREFSRKPALSFMRPFGCPVTIFNTIDHLESGPNWLFDIDALTISTNYKPVVAGNQSNGNTGTKACNDASKARMETIPRKDYILLPLSIHDPPFSSSSKDSPDAGFKPSGDEEKKDAEDPWNKSGNPTEGKDSKVSSTEEPRINQEKDDNINSTNNINTASDGNNTNNVNVVSTVNTTGSEVNVVDPKASIELPNDPNMPKLNDIFYSDDGDEDVGAETNINNLDTHIPVSLIPTTRIHKDHPVKQIIGDIYSAPQTIRMTKTVTEQAMFSLVQQRTNHKDFHNCLFACFLSQEEPKKVYRNKKDERGIVIMNKMDVKSAFLYGKIEKEVYVCQPLVFEDPDFLDRVYKVEKALYGLHQTPKAWYETLSTYLLDNGFQRGKIDKTIFIRRDKGDILFSDVKTASTPMETHKPFLKDADGEDVDEHLYRSMIGSLMYLTSSRPDIMFAVCACARSQVNPKSSHLHVVKRIFRYLKGQPKLGLWYPKDPPFDLVAYTDSDYAQASLNRKSTIGAEYIAASNCCGQSTIFIVKNPVFHSKTKHIEIRHHFIRDSNEKKLIQMIKIHTDQNVADLLTKAFDVSRFEYLIASIGMLNL
ncbi:putative ribonuclease H-like domain-containing protein [Tanacetum coccineum]|uniref:Ribonuclease H-like domain-containing protein n=1 Tax=Tanacetum coccineum TaxID=301880 RepID=A0ABQ5D283_9ASTR